ncbi:hypothetical protein EJB05_05167 [Eragrostis curvula]|uniref:Uncharacterized protein n=1 Tax=Eragrostis curvula TaxID=38414 RepID=A0A5J9WEI1_9POAL|nr:hypothetical protein EJB05_05167 [Eragrostis curvula]
MEENGKRMTKNVVLDLHHEVLPSVRKHRTSASFLCERKKISSRVPSFCFDFEAIQPQITFLFIRAGSSLFVEEEEDEGKALCK